MCRDKKNFQGFGALGFRVVGLGFRVWASRVNISFMASCEKNGSIQRDAREKSLRSGGYKVLRSDIWGCP